MNNRKVEKTQRRRIFKSVITAYTAHLRSTLRSQLESRCLTQIFKVAAVMITTSNNQNEALYNSKLGKKYNSQQRSYSRCGPGNTHFIFYSPGVVIPVDFPYFAIYYS